MSGLMVPAAQAGVFVIGCMLIQGARRHADLVTRVLTGLALVAGFMLFVSVSLRYAPESAGTYDEVALYYAAQ